VCLGFCSGTVCIVHYSHSFLWFFVSIFLQASDGVVRLTSFLPIFSGFCFMGCPVLYDLFFFLLAYTVFVAGFVFFFVYMFITTRLYTTYTGLIGLVGWVVRDEPLGTLGQFNTLFLSDSYYELV
jgi:hypothetical protein